MSEPLHHALRMLPHGPEFRFVDRLVRLVPGQNGVAEYRVRDRAEWLRGHFPGDPLFPGVLLVEAAAQLAGIVAQSDPARSPEPRLRLSALRSIKILGSARPGEMIRMEASILGRLDRLVQAQVAVFLGERCLMTGELVLSGEPEPGEGSASAPPAPGGA